MTQWLTSPYNPKKHLEVTIYDATLREGDQAPGVSFTQEEKLEIARRLDEVGLPQIEAGFPAVSGQERQSVKRVAGEGLEAQIICLGRTLESDIDCALETDVEGIILFAPTSDLHLKVKGFDRQEITDRAVGSVEYAKDHGLFTAFSAEDATRTDLGFLKEVFREVEQAGADRVHIPDTAGCIRPRGMAFMVEEITKDMEVPLGLHCHDDFGLALANSLAGLEAGARAVSVTVNGIGERTGNCALEELVLSLMMLYGTSLDLKIQGIYELSRMVEEFSGIRVGATKPVVGDNVFTHESGIHVGAVLEDPFTYEPYLPEVVGRKRDIVLGKHSGKASVEYYLRRMGLEMDPVQVREVLRQIKARGTKGGVTREEFLEIVDSVRG
jgi:methanogen homocitrate synthase